jgi:two-component system osmolarity sensor histidine kinase EnvZ
MFSDIIPKRLFPRALIIIAAPLVLLQSVLTFVSMERHWQQVTNRLSAATARDIASLVLLYDRNPEDPANRKLMQRMAKMMDLKMAFLPERKLPPANRAAFFDILDDSLGRHLIGNIDRPHWIDTSYTERLVEIRVLLSGETLQVITPRKQTYASNTHIFLAWMIGSSSVLLMIAILFLRNQIRPILQLADAADRFGKGLPTSSGFRPRGALEVRKAAQAFLRMRDRIERHVDQRTTMLAGVSHDLRTILTRFKLELALIGDAPEIVAMRKDVDEMQDMVNAYMDFAKGEGDEATSNASIEQVLQEISNEMSRINEPITLTSQLNGLKLPVRRNAFKRAVSNLISNAVRYADKVELTADKTDEQLLLHIDDNGPGIPADKRDQVFQPFVRLEDARTQNEGGSTGLGMSIARDIIHSHGGAITLSDSPLGGLRATIQIPL